VFQARAGTTYYIQGGNVFGGFGTLQLNLDAVPPPPNDNFANAIPINSLPFSDTQEITGATLESGEPNSSCSGQFTGTVWYSFTLSTTGSYTAASLGVSVYTGSSVATLTKVGSCGTFQADAGTTYYIQAGTFGSTGTITTNLEVTPPPAVAFSWAPPEPSMFDTMSFFDISFDPVNIGIQTESWNLGDGATATGCCPTHQYAKDGDYSVTLTVTTFDGRSASATLVFHVRTHDVAMTSFLAPTVAKAGKTSGFDVKLSDTRYSEQVEVDLMKSDPTAPFGGFVTVASLTKGVQVSTSGRTTDFRLSYTFTSADAALGTLTFKAVATIIGAPDAIPADNTASAPPTRVMP
jgi:PKD repeat protein